MKIPITMAEKILLHLHKYINFQDRYEIPMELSQEGIARIFNARPNHVSRAMGGLLLKGLVERRLAHVSGMIRRRRIYFLTHSGLNHAMNIEKQLSGLSIPVNENGVMMERKIGDINKDILSIVAEVNKNGFLRFGYKFYVDVEHKCEIYGRDNEINILKENIEKNDITIVYGIAGIGKSSLVYRVMNDHKNSAHIFWHTCKDNSGIDKFFHTLAMFSDAPDTSPESIYKSLGGLGAYVVIDDIHKSPQLTSVLERLISYCKLIVISREKLYVYHKRIYTLELSGIPMESAKKIVENEDICKKVKGHPLLLHILSHKGGLPGAYRYINEKVVSMLSAKEKKALAILSAFREPVVSSVIDDDKILQRLVSMHLVQMTDEGYLCHDIVKEWIILSPDEKIDIHYRAAEYMWDKNSVETIYHLYMSGDAIKLGEYLIGKSEYILSSGCLDEIIRYISTLKKSDFTGGEWVDILFIFGEIYTTRGEWERAIDVYNDIISIDTLSKMRPHIYYSIALAHRHAKNYLSCVDYYLKAYEIEPNMRRKRIILIELASTHEEFGEVYKAMEIYKKLLKELAELEDLPLIQSIKTHLKELK